jgi:hypothetical protein
VRKWEYLKENIPGQEGTKKHLINIFFPHPVQSVHGAGKSNFLTEYARTADTIRTDRFLK